MADALKLLMLIFGPEKPGPLLPELFFSFTDKIGTSPVSEVHVRFSTKKVEGIKTTYTDGSSTGWHGGGYSEDVFKLDTQNKEAIVTVWLWGSKGVVNALQFQTNHGNLSKKFGGSDGKLYILRAHPDSTKNSKLHSLTGFMGNANNENLFGVLPSWSANPVEDDLGVYLSTTDGPRWDSDGGLHGEPFSTIGCMTNVGIRAAKLQRISMFSGHRIDSLTCIYDVGNGQSAHGIAGERSGRGGSGPQLFELGDGEFITRVEGHANHDQITRLQFFTNKTENGKERSSPSYGDNSALSKPTSEGKSLLDKIEEAILDDPVETPPPPGSGQRFFKWLPPKVDSTANVGLFGFEGLEFYNTYTNTKMIGRLTPLWKIIQ